MEQEVFDFGLFKSSKGYLLGHRNAEGSFQLKKVACKGVPDGYALDFVVKGEANVLKPMRLKEALIQLQAAGDAKKEGSSRVIRKTGGSGVQREVGINVWDNVRKEMRSIYVKRQGSKGVTTPHDVRDIQEVEQNSFGAIENMESDLKNVSVTLIPKERKNKSLFTNVKIPAGWFDEEKREKLPRRDGGGEKPYYLRLSDTSGLEVGESWFAGVIIGTHKSKYGENYKLNLRYFLDEELEGDSMTAFISCKFLHQDECSVDFIGQKLEIFLKECYIPNKPVSLRVEMSDS